MRLPNVENYNNSGKFVNMFISTANSLEKSYNLLTDKDRLKFIKQVESLCRKSLEYKQYISFLKSEINMTKCSFFNNVKTDENKKIGIEIHHEPFTLFDITEIALRKYEDIGLEINPFLIAEEIMLLHYRNMVGLIPLSKTVHSLVHDGKLFIPLQNVFGNYIKFIEEYDAWIPEDILNILQTKLNMSKEIESLDTSILETKYVYLEVEGFSLPQLIQKD